MKKYTALRDKVIVSVEAEKEQVSAGGIIVGTLDIDKQFKMEGVITSIGRAAFSDSGEEDLKVGDTVIMARGSGILLESYDTGKDLKVVRDIDLCCKVEEVPDSIGEVSFTSNNIEL